MANVSSTPSTKRFSAFPTALGYGAFGLLTLGIIHSNGWLFAIGALILLPLLILVFGGSALMALTMSSMRRHPERYETQITDDSQGKISGVKWLKVR